MKFNTSICGPQRINHIESHHIDDSDPLNLPAATTQRGFPRSWWSLEFFKCQQSMTNKSYLWLRWVGLAMSVWWTSTIIRSKLKFFKHLPRTFSDLLVTSARGGKGSIKLCKQIISLQAKPGKTNSCQLNRCDSLPWFPNCTHRTHFSLSGWWR